MRIQEQQTVLNSNEISIEFARLRNTYRRLRRTESYDDQTLITQTYYEEIVDLLYRMTVQ